MYANDLSCLLIKVLCIRNDGLVRRAYCNTKTTSNGVNNMWILKYSTSSLSSLDLSVQLHWTRNLVFQHFIPQSLCNLLKPRVCNLVHNAFRKKKMEWRYNNISSRTKSPWTKPPDKIPPLYSIYNIPFPKFITFFE